MREVTWKQIALLAILVALIEKTIIQLMANVLAKQDFLMKEMKYVLNVIIPGIYIKYL